MDGAGEGRGRKLLSHLGHQVEHRNLLRRGDGEQDGAGGADKHTKGHGRGREWQVITGEHAKAFQGH